MFDLAAICDWIILAAAVCVAFTNIWKFFSNSKRGITEKVTEVKNVQEQEEKKRVIAITANLFEEHSDELKQYVIDVIDEALPSRLYAHDLATRDKYKADRQKYLREIKEEVIQAIGEKLDIVDQQEGQMIVFTEVLKELLRERIMLIYGRNMQRRELEEHEKVELDRSYRSYKSIGGNNYIDEYYERMKTWKVIPDTYNN